MSGDSTTRREGEGRRERWEGARGREGGNGGESSDKKRK
jgi:hypothetical protein